MRFRHIVMIIVIIALIFLLLYSSKFKRQSILKTTGGGADDIGKQIIGMFIGSLKNYKITYKATGPIQLVEIKPPPCHSFFIYSDSLKSLSSISLKETSNFINVEFNEDYITSHRIKCVYTSFMLIMTLLKLKYSTELSGKKIKMECTKTTVPKTSMSGRKTGVDYIYEYKLIHLPGTSSTTQITKIDIDTTYTPYTIRFININYNKTDKLIEFINHEDQIFKILKKLAFDELVDSTSFNNDTIITNKLDSLDINLFTDDNRNNQSNYGYNLVKITNPVDNSKFYNISRLNKRTNTYGFNYMDIEFGSTFNFSTDFNNVIIKICELHDLKINFFDELLEKYNNPKNITNFIRSLKSSNLPSNYEYVDKLLTIIEKLKNGATIDDLSTVYEIYPDFLAFR